MNYLILATRKKWNIWSVPEGGISRISRTKTKRNHQYPQSRLYIPHTTCARDMYPFAYWKGSRKNIYHPCLFWSSRHAPYTNTTIQCMKFFDSYWWSRNKRWKIWKMSVHHDSKWWSQMKHLQKGWSSGVTPKNFEEFFIYFQKSIYCRKSK